MCIKMMNDKEAAEYADRLEKVIPAIRQGETGPLTEQREQALLDYLDSFSAQYIRAKANATNKPVSLVISDLIHRELASIS
jgi:hypothetical protein